MGPVIAPSDWRWVGSISAGPIWEDAGRTQTFFLTPEIEKTYTANNQMTVFGAGELFAGVQKMISPTWQVQLGLALMATGDATVGGEIWDDADPAFNNHTYRYKVQHTHAALKGKALMDAGYWMMPYISGSVGVGFNRAQGFTNTPIIFEAIPNNNFSSNTKTTFSYTVGAGLQRALNDQWQVGVGYEFADWGNSGLGRAAEQTLNSGLSLNNFYTHGLMINITYLM
jgi:opacity protein-like surface antigen